MISEQIEWPSIAHITDAHVSAAPFKPSAVLKHRSREILADFLEQLKEKGVDLTLFGGDNIDNRVNGHEDLEAFQQLLAHCPNYALIAGNHESERVRTGRVSKTEFLSRFAHVGTNPETGCFSRSVGKVRVIGIDTTLLGAGGGYVSDETMRFLAEEIALAPEPHIIVLGHHLLVRPWAPVEYETWDREYLVANREAVVALLENSPRVRAYLCGHHHGSRIQRVGSRGSEGGFFHILGPSPVAYPAAVRILHFRPQGMEIETLQSRCPNVLEEAREAVLHGRKARRFAQIGARMEFLDYVAGGVEDNSGFKSFGLRSRPSSASRVTGGVQPRALR